MEEIKNQYINNEQELDEMSEDVQKAYDNVPDEKDIPDVDAAWKKFDAEHHVSPRPTTMWWKSWSVAAGFLLVFTLAVAISVDKFAPAIPAENDKTNNSSLLIPDSSLNEGEVEETSTEVIYRNAPLTTILEQLASANSTHVEYLKPTDLRLYVTIDRSWSLQQCIDFLNNFEQVQLTLTADNVIEVR